MIMQNCNHGPDGGCLPGLCAGCCTPEQIMETIFTGNPSEAIEFFRQLQSLGDGIDGDRLRTLLVALVTFAQRQRHPHRGSFLWPDGRPMTPVEIAREIVWDETAIGDDLQQLARVRLLEYSDLSIWPTEEAA